MYIVFIIYCCLILYFVFANFAPLHKLTIRNNYINVPCVYVSSHIVTIISTYEYVSVCI